MNPLDKNAPTSYLSVGALVPCELVIEKSKFLGFACPVESIEAIETLLKIYRERYKDANHLCYAYVIGQGGLLMKASDDGEPTGTAGVPILEVLKKEGLTDVLVMVVRYFGGIKLGSGGLIRAYGKSAKEAVLSSGICYYRRHYPLAVTLDYTLSGGFSHFIKEMNWRLERQDFTDKVTYHLEVPENDLAATEASIINFTKNQVTFQKGALHYLAEKGEL